MKNWKTRIYLHHESGRIVTEPIYFSRGIFQGDSLSPLLFCMCLVPVTNYLRRLRMGYKLDNLTISNLLYMDDLKVYTRSDSKMERYRTAIQEFSEDIRMEFGLKKCAVLQLKHGQPTTSNCVADIPYLETNTST